MARKTSWFLHLKNPRRNPFVGAPVLGAQSTADDELTTGQRVLRNQVLTRSAPAAGRASTTMGAAAVAIGTKRSRSPKKGRFSVIDKRTARKTGQFRKDTRYYRRSRYASDIGEQEKRFANRKARPRGRALRAGGTALMIGGKALPIIAYGYIGYDLYTQRASPTVARQTVETATFGMTAEQATASARYTIPAAFQTAKVPARIVASVLF